MIKYNTFKVKIFNKRMHKASTLTMVSFWNPVCVSGHGSVDDMLDAENKRLAENLATKVSRLKSLAYDIDREADDQNEYLDNMVSPCALNVINVI